MSNIGRVDTIVGVDASAGSIGWVPPIDKTGLKFANFFGGDATRSARNLAPDGQPVIVVGDPTENTRYTTFTPGSKYIQTAATEAADKTLISVVMPLSDANSAILGNYKGPRVGDPSITAFGNALYFLPSTAGDGLVSPNYQDGGWSGDAGSASSSVAIAIPNGCAVNSWYFLVGRTVNNVRKIFNKTTGAANQSPTTTLVDRASTAYQIGSMPTYTGFTAPNNQAFAMEIERGLSDAEIDALYLAVKTVLAGYGIVC